MFEKSEELSRAWNEPIPVAYNENRLNFSDKIKQLQPKIDLKIAQMISDSVVKYSRKYKIEPEIILGIISVESAFRQMATSNRKCIGLMQVNYTVHSDKLKKRNLTRLDVYGIDNNIDIGCEILSDYIRSYGEIEMALKKYIGKNSDIYVKNVLGVKL
jgi:soluble lytic murein transglycosylase-like protein